MIFRIQFIWSKYHYLIHDIQNLNNMSHLASIHNCSEYNHTKQIFVNSYPWLFPGGISDVYGLEQGKISIKEWGQHLLQYYNGRFLEDSLFGYFCIIPSRDTQITVRAISSSNLIASLVETHQLFKN
jgi:hypothetical protein